MNQNIKLSVTSLFLAVFVSACDSSASSDAKKVDMKPATPVSVEPVSKPEVAEPASKEMESTHAKPAMPDSEVVKSDTLKASDEFIEGTHYVKVLPEIQTDVAPGKIEVAELFWLGCPHCYSLEPEIVKYKANHPDYVEFKQVPAMLNPSWASEANTYFISEILDPKGSKDLVTKLFDAIHKEKRSLRSPKAVTRFFVEQGYTEEQVDGAKKSMAFQTKLVRAQEFGAKSQANSVPTIIINGKYRTSPNMVGGNANLMKVVDMLAAKENESK